MDGRVRGARDGSPRHSPRCCAGASTRTRSTPARPRSASAPRRAAWMPQPAAGASRPSKSGSHPQGHVCTSVSLLERHSLRSHSGYTRARHPVTLFHGNEATLPSPHHKDQPGSHALAPLPGLHTKDTEAHSGSPHSHTNTHTHAQRTALHVRDIPPRKGHPGLHTRVSSLWTRCARSCYTALHATRQHLLAVGARRRRHWTHGCHVARASRSGQRRCIIKRPSP